MTCGGSAEHTGGLLEQGIANCCPTELSEKDAVSLATFQNRSPGPSLIGLVSAPFSRHEGAQPPYWIKKSTGDSSQFWGTNKPYFKVQAISLTVFAANAEKAPFQLRPKLTAAFGLAWKLERRRYCRAPPAPEAVEYSPYKVRF